MRMWAKGEGGGEEEDEENDVDEDAEEEEEEQEEEEEEEEAEASVLSIGHGTRAPDVERTVSLSLRIATLGWRCQGIRPMIPFGLR